MGFFLNYRYLKDKKEPRIAELCTDPQKLDLKI